LLFAVKEIGLRINKSRETNCIIMSLKEKAGKSDNVKTGDRFFEGVGQLKYL
jgi:hypothetical protein